MAGISPGFDTAGFADAIIKRYGNINVDSLDTSGYAYNELKLWKMFIPQNVRQCREFIPQAYEIPKDIQKKLRETGQLDEELSEEQIEKYRKAYMDQPVSSVLELIEDQRRPHLVILGDPGSGKSSLVQYLSLKWARMKPSERAQAPLPLLIELRVYARDCENAACTDFLSFCHRGNSFYRFDETALHNRFLEGNAMVFFDGLDEVFDPKRREDVITAIMRFVVKYPDAGIMVTSRVIGYQHKRFQDAEFEHYMLQDLDDNQIRDFIVQWHGLTYNDMQEKERKQNRLPGQAGDPAPRCLPYADQG